MTTNPSQLQVDYMKDQIAVLGALKNEIERLEASLKATKLEYTQLKNSLARITILPNELLASIFEAGCNNHDAWNIPLLPNLTAQRLPVTRRPPQEYPFEILVSQITRHWRCVAHQTPTLWQRITLDTKTRHFLDIGADYIMRSGALSLDLRIDLSYEQGLLRPPIKSICHLINPEIRRLYQFRVNCDWYPGLQYMLESMPSSAPLLQYLELCYENHRVSPPDDPEHPATILSGGISSLTHMVLRGITLRCHLPPLTALTNLECHFMQLSSVHHMVHDLFKNLAQLTRLVLNDIEFDWAGTDGFELPALVALYLRNIPDYDQVLRVLSAPYLQTLYLNTVDSNEIRNFPNALALESGQTKFPHLREVFIKPVEYEPFMVTAESWRAFALITPTVTHFGLLHEEIDEFLQSLSPMMESDTASSPTTHLPITWPKLHTLSLPEALHTNSVDAVISARVVSPCPIRRIQVSDNIVAGLSGALEAWRNDIEIVACDEVVRDTLYPELWRKDATESDGWPDNNDADAISDFTDTSSTGSPLL